MANLRSIVFAAALAGLIVGLVVTVAQRFGTVPLILHAEVYEQAAEAAALTVSATPHDHDADTAAAPDHGPAAGLQAHHHEHGAAAWEPADGIERTAYTALFNVLDWIGFGLMLTGLLVLLGRPVTWREGFLWGLGGFAAFVIAPSLGLPPELPGIPAAPLTPRQIWWVATALVTAIGLWLIVFRPQPLVGRARDRSACRTAPDRRPPARRGRDQRPGGAFARVRGRRDPHDAAFLDRARRPRGYLYQRFAQAA